MKRFAELASRSLAKAITFRTVILISDSIVIFIVTKRLDITLSVIIVSNVFSTLLYYLHERVWDKIHWGKKAENNS